MHTRRWLCLLILFSFHPIPSLHGKLSHSDSICTADLGLFMTRGMSKWLADKFQTQQKKLNREIWKYEWFCNDDDDDGIAFKSYIVILSRTQIGVWQSWKHHDQLDIKDIIWPGYSHKPPDGVPEKFHLKIAFLEEPPFIKMADPDPVTGHCSPDRGVRCRIAPESEINVG